MEPSNFDLKETISENKFVSLWRLMTSFRLIYVVAVVALGLAALAQTSIFYVLRYVVDEVLVQEQLTGTLPWMALVVVILAVIQGGFTFLSGWLAARTAEGVTIRLRDYLYDHLQRLSFSYHDKVQTGELLQRATSDVDEVRRFFSEQAVGIGRIVLLFVVNFVALLNLNVALAFWSIIIIPLVIMASLWFPFKIGHIHEGHQEQEARMSNRLQENLTGIQVVKAFARQAYEREKFDIESDETRRLGQQLIFMHSGFWSITDILCGGQMLFGFFMGASMAIEGRISVGTYLAYAGLVVMIIWPIRNLGRLITHMSTALVSYERIMQIIRKDREPLDQGSYLPTDGIQGAVRFEQVEFAYDAELPVLHQINFEALPGQAIALLGSTGSGKTSLVNLLPRFYDYNGGQITLDGVELREYPRRTLRQEIGIVQQEPFLFSRTIRENITYGVGRQVSDKEVETAARAAAIHEVILSFPKGYATLVGERGVTLSGGQKQRVTIARALLKNPRILILDDATSSVDSETDASIRQALQALMQNRTTFIIAHRVQSVMNADLILVLDEGRIVQRGTHHELIAQPGIYQQIYQLQAQIEEELTEELAFATQSSNGHVNGYRKEVDFRF